MLKKTKFEDVKPKKTPISKEDAKNLKKMYFILALEWDKKKNGPIPDRTRIQDFAFNEYYWICEYCGNSWVDSISNRLRGEKPCKCGQRQGSIREK